MLDKIKEKLVEQLKTASKDGIKTGNIEYISKLAETYKNLNKAEKEEVETMIYDDRLDRRYDRVRDYDDDNYSIYSRSGRGEYARRDVRGRYAEGGRVPDAIRHIQDGYDEYYGAKRKYRNSGGAKEDVEYGVDMLMKHIYLLIEDLYNECESEDEHRIMDKYINKISSIK